MSRVVYGCRLAVKRQRSCRQVVASHAYLVGYKQRDTVGKYWHLNLSPPYVKRASVQESGCAAGGDLGLTNRLLDGTFLRELLKPARFTHHSEAAPSHTRGGLTSFGQKSKIKFHRKP